MYGENRTPCEVSVRGSKGNNQSINLLILKEKTITKVKNYYKSKAVTRPKKLCL